MADTQSLQGVVAVGASAGGVEALIQFSSGLRANLPFAVLVALHIPAEAPSVLAQIIDRSGPLPAMSARHGEALEPGLIYVAVPDRHLLVADSRVVLSEGPTENTYRPAINALFRSVALDFGPRAICVLMSGVLDDGVLGARAIRSRGGTTIVQHPDDALYKSMPLNAIRAGVVDHRVAAKDVGALLESLANREIEDQEMEPDDLMKLENRIAMGPRFGTPFDSEELGPPSGYTCPDCNGSLMEISKDNYRCRVGHAWTADALLTARDDEVEGALWVALRSLQEKAKLARRMAENVGSGVLFDRYTTQADEAERALTILGKRLSEAASDRGELID
ncbi:chemotaxis protein CheB [Mycolicibacterium celeriflavum]|uniref:protein-glutamate methylesterase n=1 Tax=Mycolicibacterium celeriflavum TaxID=1249101 RepID=A0A1X0BUX1_MYCCF|nr:chemotaxis protein CheB [Mycolicibacterium celeriflavum]MCV7237471.1 chemotaxis protein CheB [Mycolicibacterium celeriflavum]ORA47830.1 chemotaxis protein CheB [Mycolicibacterium celeriflavum]BBY45893.1 chemotaxis protein CheB [Mycolicibacterium celeriflavum]